jgi:hypothetical protein
MGVRGQQLFPQRGRLHPASTPTTFLLYQKQKLTMECLEREKVPT